MANEMLRPVLEVETERQENVVAELQGQKIIKVLDENKELLQENESFNVNNTWKLKKRIFPRSSEPPFAILDNNGNLVTEYDNILDIMKQEFTHRLRNREISHEYVELKQLKEYLCKLRLELTRKGQYKKWTSEQLTRAIMRLKSNKCRDPHGHINELYKYMGNHGLSSLLQLLNKIKDELINA